MGLSILDLIAAPILLYLPVIAIGSDLLEPPNFALINSVLGCRCSSQRFLDTFYIAINLSPLVCPKDDDEVVLVKYQLLKVMVGKVQSIEESLLTCQGVWLEIMDAVTSSSTVLFRCLVVLHDLPSVAWEDRRLVEVCFISTDLPNLKNRDLFNVLLNCSRLSLMEIVPFTKIGVNILGYVGNAEYVHSFPFDVSWCVASLERFEQVPEVL
ncbi:MAG: hypothetical protein EZS28_028914 [Streblomastix strix]|uniref:Uncharacterized protein n=1 Tax=Streblomastix strix TaxID=222440 RepID=A0A5J4UZL0_9EUKA|nr:MAG: hypothetical protein EZS28_028914 [Streblomastix strix]